MLERTRTPRTDEPVELRVLVRPEALEAAREAVRPYQHEDEETLDWREAFPEFGPHVVLAGCRHREELTQQQLADRVGISRSNLSAMERGRRPIGKEMAKRLAKELNADYRLFL